AAMDICQPTEEQKKGYFDRVPFAYTFDDKVLMPGMVSSNEVIRSLKDFPLDEDDVVIVTYPKSGTTWSSELISAIVHQGDTEGITPVPMEQRVPWLEMDYKYIPEDSFIHPKNRAAPLPSAKKRVWFTHLYLEYLPEAAKQGKCKVLYVGRNPKDTAVSFLHFHYIAKHLGCQTSMDFNEFFPLFTSGYVLGGEWFKHNTDYWKWCQNNPNARFVKFEDMKKDLAKEVESLEKFIGVPLTAEQRAKVVDHCSFKSMKGNKSTNRVEIKELFDKEKGSFIRKGVVGDWKNNFTVAQNEAFDALYKKKMEGSGLDYE
ncbi:hypothetical protein PMAYCL1PPCAC_19632, partial [Pristionchus mayeri]